VDFRERCVSHSKGFDSFYVIVLKGGKKVYNKRSYIFYTQSTLVENNVMKNSSKINDIEPYDDSFSLKLANSHLFEST
jgi:hypothetical protein